MIKMPRTKTPDVLFKRLLSDSVSKNIKFPVFDFYGKALGDIENYKGEKESIYVIRKDFSSNVDRNTESTMTFFLFSKEGIGIVLYLDCSTSRDSVEDYNLPQGIKDYAYKVFFKPLQ